MICEMCGKEFKQLDTHHIIPRYIGIDTETIEVCKKCHHKADMLFNGYILYPFGKPEQWRNKEKQKRFNKGYKTKYDFTDSITITIEENLYIQIRYSVTKKYYIEDTYIVNSKMINRKVNKKSISISKIYLEKFQ